MTRTGGDAVHAVGVDVGGTKILAVLVAAGDRARVVAERRIATPPGARVLDTVTELVEGLAAEVGVPVGAVGVGLPGLVDRAGVFHEGPHVPGLEGLPVADRLAERLGVPTAVDNDAACAARAEFDTGAGRGFADGLLLTIGTGIGGGIVMDGALRRGGRGFAAEVGHQVVDPDGPPCPCGRRGCWEQFASGSALGRLARESGAAGDGEGLVELVRAGDAAAGAVFDRYVGHLVVGVVNLIEILDPSVLVVGGGLAAAADVLLPRLDRALGEGGPARGDRSPVRRRAVPVVVAHHGERAGAVGAAAAGLSLR